MVVRFPLDSACEVGSVDISKRMVVTEKVDSDEFSLEAWWPCSATEAKHHNKTVHPKNILQNTSLVQIFTIFIHKICNTFYQSVFFVFLTGAIGILLPL